MWIFYYVFEEIFKVFNIIKIINNTKIIETILVPTYFPFFRMGLY